MNDEPKAPVRSARRRLLRVAFGLLVGLAVVETALRAATVDAGHGQVRVAFIGLVPYPPPAAEPEPFQAPTGYLAYDAHAGWAPRPLGASADGMYCADQRGLRAPSAAPREFPAGRTRILLSGDSFAHSDEVRYEESLGVAIESLFPDSVVLNAGVPGYGTDQAYLRFLAHRGDWKPDVVLIGVHQNDFERNVRLFAGGGEWGGTLPFSKPRFVRDGGSFRLVNSPPVRGDAIRRLFDDYDATDFAKSDWFHVAGEYEPRWTDHVRTLRFLRSFLVHQEYRRRYMTRERPDAGNEIHAVTEHVVETFAKDAAAGGAVPIVVALPARWQLVSWRNGNPWWDATLRSAADRASCAYVDVTPALSDDLERRGKDVLEPFTQKGMGHYTAATNAFVARCLKDALSRALDEARRRR